MKKSKQKNLQINNFSPLWDNVIVKPIKLEQKDDFVRPQQEEDKSELGIVIAIGSDVDSTKVEIGDTVLFNKYSSTSMDIGDELIVRAEDIVAVLRND